MINFSKIFFDKKIFTFLYVLLPIALITGPFLSDLIIVTICAYLILNLKSFTSDTIFELKIHYYFAFFYLSICFSSIISEYSLYSLKSSISYVRFGFFSFAVYFLIKNNKNIILLITKIFLIIFFILLFDSFFQYLFDYNLVGWRFDGHSYRVTSFFGDDEVLGSYIARLFPFVLSLIIFSQNELNFKFNNLFFILFFACSSLITLISGERTSMALLLLCILVMFFTCHKLRKLILHCSIVILISLTTVIFTSETTKNRMLSQTLKQLGLVSKSERIVVFSKTYESHYKIALKMIKQKPFFGHGPKTFRKFCAEPENFINDVACTTHPHNILMQLLSETGIVGTLIYFIIFISLLLKLIKISLKGIFYKDKSQKEYLTLIYIFYFINLFPFAPSGNFFNNWLSIIYYLPLGYFFFLLKYEKKTQ